MNDLKYIIVSATGCEHYARAIVFNGLVTHSSVVHDDMGTVLSAGFLALNVVAGEIKAKCYGKSVSLDFESRPNLDAIVVEKTLSRNHGYF